MLKSEGFEAEKDESWFTFIDNEANTENKRITTKENEDNEYTTWLATLTEDNKERIVNERKTQSKTNLTFPQSFLLKSYFRDLKAKNPENQD